MTSTHQLAAIMFTDIVGYTTLMGQDQKKAMELVEKNRSIQMPIVKKHGGTWHKDMGDGSLISFNSAIEAVECAIEIQEAAHKTPDLLLRIGIHLGDVTFKENDVYGDGVNISSRIESIADPGGIYISESVSKAIKGRSVIQTQFLGEFFLKHVDEPVKIFALRGEGLPEPSKKYQPGLSVSFWTLLKQRNVFRAAITYLIFAVLLFQLVKYFLDNLDPTITIGALGLGFLIALYMAWNYEFSPKGIVRTQSKEAVVNPYSSTQKKPLTNNLVIGILAAIIAVMYIFPDQLGIVGDTESTTSTATSIAVLPFDNMSGDEDQVYFSDGLSEELINALVKIPGLKVAGRTSAFSYKGRNENLTTIGKELGVSNILEGSVRKSGDQIRITAQLINAEDGFHIWSEVYDRQLTDIFAIQDEITNSIIKALSGIIIEQKELQQKIETANIDAYTIYLQARHKLAKRQIENLIDAKSLFEEAIRLDQSYSPAHSGLARTLSLIPLYSYTHDPEMVEASKKAAMVALEINPENAEAFSVIGTNAIYYDWDWKAAEKANLRALEISPYDAEINNFAGDYYRITLHPRCIELEKQAVELDPLHAVNHWDLGWAYVGFKDWENALKYGKSGLQLGFPNWFDNIQLFTVTYRELGKDFREIEQMLPEFENPDDPYVMHIRSVLEFGKGNKEEAIVLANLVEEETKAGNYSPVILSMLFLNIGEVERAAYWLSITEKDPNVIFYFLMSMPFVTPEELPDHEGIRKALDTPELEELWKIRISNLQLRVPD